MKKKHKRVGAMLCAVLAAASLGLTSCKGDAMKENSVHNGFTYSFEQVGDGYRLKFGFGGDEYSTRLGAAGVRFDRTANTATDCVYADYSEVHETEGGYVASAVITSPRGSQILLRDWFTAVSGALEVTREMEVVKVGRDNGFATEFTFLTEEEASLGGSSWFNPAQYYVNGTHTFMNSTTRSDFSAEKTVICGDFTSALYVSRLHGKVGTTLTDLTDTRQETVAEDNTLQSHLMIDEEFNMTGVGFGTEFGSDGAGRLSMSFYYPSHSKLWSDNTVWRLLPLEDGLRRTVRFSISMEEYDSYEALMRETYRSYFDRVGVTEFRYDPEEVYEAYLENVQNSFRASNDWGNIPQYFVNYDHHFPESGFLYRNLDLAIMMYKAGVRLNRPQYCETAATVMRYQLGNDMLDTGITSNSGIVRRRTRYEGFCALIDTYLFFREQGDPFADDPILSCDAILSYLERKAETYQDEDTILGLIFYIPLWKYQDELGFDYSQTAQRLLGKLVEDDVDFSGYFGTIDSNDPYISAAEDYMTILHAYLGAYEITGVERWLALAERTATMLDTFQVVQPIDLLPYGDVGTQGLKSTFIGNERFTARGYNFNNTGHAILDTGTVSAAVDYYKLFKLTGEDYYRAMAEYKLYNAAMYVDMGDKVGYMDDLVHSAGMGFTNEFVGPTANSMSAADSGMRGAAHDSALPWYTYSMMYIYDYFIGEGGTAVPEDMAMHSYDLAKRAYTQASSYKSGLFGPWNAVDAKSERGWAPAAEDPERTLTVDLNEFCSLEKVEGDSGAPVAVSASVDGVNFTALGTLNGSLDVSGGYRYVRFTVEEGQSLKNVAVYGTPVRYVNHSLGARVLSASGNSSSLAIDGVHGGGNYVTAWDGGASTGRAVMTLDLGSVKEIYQTALKFATVNTLQFNVYAANYMSNIYDPAIGHYSYLIEMSEDGKEWTEYARTDDTRLIFVDEGYTRARYVRLTLLGSGYERYLVSDFKVMGR